MAFEIFTDTGARTREFISITRTKTFGVPRAFLDKHGITAEHKAVILYDAESKRIALHFTTNAPKVGLTVRVTDKKQGAIIAARSFFDIKDIDVERYFGRYDFEKTKLIDIGIDKPGDAFIITLQENEEFKARRGEVINGASGVSADNTTNPRDVDIDSILGLMEDDNV